MKWIIGGIVWLVVLLLFWAVVYGGSPRHMGDEGLWYKFLKLFKKGR